MEAANVAEHHLVVSNLKLARLQKLNGNRNDHGMINPPPTHNNHHAWLEKNYDHRIVKAIRHSEVFSGPLAMMLFPGQPALTIFGPRNNDPKCVWKFSSTNHLEFGFFKLKSFVLVNDLDSNGPAKNQLPAQVLEFDPVVLMTAQLTTDGMDQNVNIVGEDATRALIRGVSDSGPEDDENNPPSENKRLNGDGSGDLGDGGNGTVIEPTGKTGAVLCTRQNQPERGSSQQGLLKIGSKAQLMIGAVYNLCRRTRASRSHRRKGQAGTQNPGPSLYKAQHSVSRPTGLFDRSYAVLGFEAHRPSAITRDPNANNVQNNIIAIAGLCGIHPGSTAAIADVDGHL
ncbi:hypothetical protein C8R44DRAFT_734623 [Mycena epipterygia]|nr:hypothetical protein C8R44DRAFT_734623 [Mycena epipterygia]